MNPVIAAHGLTKRFGGKTVVDHLDLAVPAGSVYALLGDNGAGKSTTIRMLTGLLPSDGGRAEIFGLDCWAAAPVLRRRVGYVPEKPRFYDWMTVKRDRLVHLRLPRPRLPAALPRSGRPLPPGRFGQAQNALQRRICQGRPGAGPRLRAGSAHPRRTDLRPRPVHSPRISLQHGGPRRRRPHHPHLQSRRRRGGARRQPRGFSSGGSAAAGRPAGRAAAAHRPRPFCASRPCAPDGAALGRLLDTEVSGRQWQAVLLDPDRAALDALRQRPDLEDVEESPLTLEEMYTALLARYHTAAPPAASANGRAASPESAALAPGEEGVQP